MAFGNVPKDAAGIPIGGLYTPNTGFAAFQGGTQTTDDSGNVYAPAEMHLADGAQVTLGAKADVAQTDATQTTSTHSFIKGIVKILADMWDGVNHWLQVKVMNTVSVSGTVTANVDATNSTHIANTDTATATTATNTGNIFTRLANIATMVFDNTDKLRISLYVKTTAAADTILTLGRTTKAGSLPVTMASDQDAISTTDTNSTAMNTSLTTLSGIVSSSKAAVKAASGDFADGSQVAIGTTTQTKATDGSVTSWSVIQILKGILDRLFNGTIAVTGTFWQATQPVSGTVTANGGTPSVYTTSTLTNIVASTSDTAVLASNSNRKGGKMFNDSTAICYLSEGSGAASTTSHTVQIPAQGFYEIPPVPIGTIAYRAVWSAANGTLRVTENT